MMEHQEVVVPQPTIEQRTLLKRPEDIATSTLWRRQRFADLRAGKVKPADPQEQQRLEHEIQIMTARENILHIDQTVGTLGEAFGRLIGVNNQLEAMRTKKVPGDHFTHRGLQIRQELLQNRIEELKRKQTEKREEAISIEERSQLYRLETIQDSLGWRENRLEELRKGMPPNDPNEFSRLTHEVHVIQARKQVLEKDQRSRSISDVERDLNEIDAFLVHKRDQLPFYEKQGLLIRREILEKRKQILAQPQLSLRVQLYTLDKIPQSLQWRVDRLRALQNGASANFPEEEVELTEEVAIIENRKIRLEESKNAPTLDDVERKYADIVRGLNLLKGKTDSASSMYRTGYEIQQDILLKRGAELGASQHVEKNSNRTFTIQVKAGEVILQEAQAKDPRHAVTYDTHENIDDAIDMYKTALAEKRDNQKSHLLYDMSILEIEHLLSNFASVRKSLIAQVDLLLRDSAVRSQLMDKKFDEDITRAILYPRTTPDIPYYLEGQNGSRSMLPMMPAGRGVFPATDNIVLHDGNFFSWKTRWAIRRIVSVKPNGEEIISFDRDANIFNRGFLNSKLQYP